jgi:methionyl-tRNA synthetase
MLAQIAAAPAKVGAHIEAFHFREALAEAMALARVGNKYFNDAEPWAARKSNPRACGNTLHVAMQLCASLSIIMEPFVPFTAAQIRRMLALDGVRPSTPFAAIPGRLGWNDAANPLLAAGHALGAVEILVRKVEDDAIDRQVAKLREAEARLTKDEKPFKSVADAIDYDAFAKLDLRVGCIRVCESVPKSKKLLRCDVDLGFETRQVLAGVAEHFRPEQMVGRKVVIVANLAPRKMMGLESRGMILMATDRDGHLTPLFADCEPGSTIS